MEETKGTMGVTVQPGGSSTGQGQQAVNVHDAQLLSRLVLGVVLFGGEELLLRLRLAQQRLEAVGGLADADNIPDDETMTDVLAYLAVGMVMRGQRRVGRMVKRGLNASMNAAGRAFGIFSRVTDNRLARPFREPIDRRIGELMLEGQVAIQDGRREVYASRKLTDETLAEIVQEVIQTLAENPELTVAIERVVAGQGATLTGTVVGNTRQLGLSADDLAEGVARRLLRRKPRRELPPSPLVGKPQTMYGLQSPEPGAQDDDL
jgi:hypothetical protein